MTHKKLALYIVLPLLVVIALSWGLFAIVDNRDRGVDNDGPVESINLDPPTQEDLQRSEANKKAIEKRNTEVENAPVVTTGGIKVVKPIITYAGQYGAQVEVGAYMGDIYEEGGTCTAEFMKGSTTFTRKVQAVKSAKSTDCPAIIVSNQDFLQKGTWSVKVLYSSSSASGTSDARTIEVN